MVRLVLLEVRLQLRLRRHRLLDRGLNLRHLLRQLRDAGLENARVLLAVAHVLLVHLLSFSPSASISLAIAWSRFTMRRIGFSAAASLPRTAAACTAAKPSKTKRARIPAAFALNY